MNKRLRALIARRENAIENARGILSGVGGDESKLTATQQQRIDEFLAEAADLKPDIEEEERLSLAIRSGEIDDRAAIDPTGGRARADSGGFSDFGEFVHQVMRAADPRVKSVDPRLSIGAAPTTYGSEGIGEDGGYLVPPEWARDIFSHSLENDSLLPFCRSTPVNGNHMVFPVSEDTPWSTAGVQCYWEGEAGQIGQSKPAFEARELRLRKLTALVPVTNELLEDATALASWLPIELGKAARWHVNDKVVNGAGSGVPQGFTQSGALITQAAEGSQAADTIVAGNVSKMYARCTNPSTAVWLINPDAFHQLPLLTIGDQPVWIPNSDGMKSSPGGMLLGRPVIMTDACQTVGDAGDFYFADLQSYAVIQKRTGARIDTSMHLWFDYDMTAFRLTFRVDGQSLVRSEITPPNSSVTRSPFVRLAARA